MKKYLLQYVDWKGEDSAPNVGNDKPEEGESEEPEGAEGKPQNYLLVLYDLKDFNL